MRFQHLRKRSKLIAHNRLVILKFLDAFVTICFRIGPKDSITTWRLNLIRENKRPSPPYWMYSTLCPISSSSAARQTPKTLQPVTTWSHASDCTWNYCKLLTFWGGWTFDSSNLVRVANLKSWRPAFSHFQRWQRNCKSQLSLRSLVYVSPLYRSVHGLQ